MSNILNAPPQRFLTAYQGGYFIPVGNSRVAPPQDATVKTLGLCDEQCQPTTGFFQSHQRWRNATYTFSQMKKLCILQGSAVTFLGVVGKGVKVCFLLR